MKTLRVLGALSAGEVRIKMEWSLIWPVNLFALAKYLPTLYTLSKSKGDKRDMHEQLLVSVTFELGFLF
jgi:hypothetical protein